MTGQLLQKDIVSKGLISVFLLIIFLLSENIQAQDTLQKTNWTYTGSSTIGNLVEDASPVFGKVNFKMDTRPESAGGELAILEGRTDLAGVARLPNVQALGKGVVSSLIGWDAIAVIIHPDNPIQNLTQSQLKSIFTGQVQNWKQLGGPDVEIHPYIVDVESATRKVFRSVILGEADYEACVVVKPDADILKKIENDPGGIGQISFSFLKAPIQVKAISVNGQPLELTNSHYPITRPLYLLWWPGRKDVREFVDWIQSREGQRIVMQRFIGTSESTIQTGARTGTLIVYTETSPVEDGGIFYYPHQSYEVLTQDRTPFMTVPNHLSHNDETPSRVELNPGSYLIRPSQNADEAEEFFVTIESGRVTKVNRMDLIYPGQDLALRDTPRANVSATDAAPAQSQVFNFYGDFRVRAEQDLLSSGDRFRGRFRIRAGMVTQVSPEARFDLRLVSTTDPNDPNSSHVDLDDGFNQIQIAIDRASFYLRPSKLRYFELRLGKFSNPNLSSNLFSELVWDADIQPEGTAFTLDRIPIGKAAKISLVSGTYLLTQFKFGERKNWLNTTQVWADWRLSESCKVTLAGSFYYFANIKGEEITDLVLDANEGNSTYEKMITVGNTTLLTTHYKTNFHLLDNFVLLEFNQLPWPLLLKFQMVHNVSASARNRGYITGISYGAQENKDEWKAYYQYHYLQQDAVFTPFVQDDALRKTNAKGHIFGLAYTFHKSISLQAWGLVDKPLEGGDVQSRFRLDLNVKF